MFENAGNPSGVIFLRGDEAIAFDLLGILQWGGHFRQLADEPATGRDTSSR